MCGQAGVYEYYLRNLSSRRADFSHWAVLSYLFLEREGEGERAREREICYPLPAKFRAISSEARSWK